MMGTQLCSDRSAASAKARRRFAVHKVPFRSHACEQRIRDFPGQNDMPVNTLAPSFVLSQRVNNEVESR